MSNLSGESREQNRKDKVTRFRYVTYARQLGLLLNAQGSHLKGLFIVENLCSQLAYPASLHSLHSNTQKQIIQIKHNRIKNPN